MLNESELFASFDNHTDLWVFFQAFSLLMELIFIMGIHILMMTSTNGNIFLNNGLLWGEFTGHRGIPLTKASDSELWCFLWSVPEQADDKQLRRRWLEIPSSSLWRHCNVVRRHRYIGFWKWKHQITMIFHSLYAMSYREFTTYGRHQLTAYCNSPTLWHKTKYCLDTGTLLLIWLIEGRINLQIRELTYFFYYSALL